MREMTADLLHWFLNTPQLARFHPSPRCGHISWCGTFGCQDCFSIVGELRLCKPCVARQTGSSVAGGSSLLGPPGHCSGACTSPPASRLSSGANLNDELTAGNMVAGLLAPCSSHLHRHGVDVLPMVSPLGATCRSPRVNSNDAAGAVGSWFIPFVNLVRPFDLSAHARAWTQTSDSPVPVWSARGRR